MFPSRTVTPPLDLSHLPRTYLLPTHLAPEKLLELQDKLRACKCPLTDTASDASLFIADVNTEKRSELELRKKEIAVISNTEDSAIANATIWPIRVVKLEWFTKSLETGQAEKLEEYTVLSATVALARPKIHTASPKPATTVIPDSNTAARKRKEILERAQTDAAESPQPKRARYGRTEKQKGIDLILSITKKAPLLRRSTSSFEGKRSSNDLPDWVRTKV
jgi:DNA polymerase IV